jgi:hypothetical protein
MTSNGNTTLDIDDYARCMIRCDAINCCIFQPFYSSGSECRKMLMAYSRPLRLIGKNSPNVVQDSIQFQSH